MTIKPSSMPRVWRTRSGNIVTIAVVGLTTGLGLWAPLMMLERRHLAAATQQAMESLRADLESDLQARLLAQVRLAELWSTRVVASESQWELSSRLFLDHHPGYLTVEWADGAGRVLCAVGRQGDIKRSVRPPGTEQALTRFRLARAVAPDAPTLMPRFSLADGSQAMRVVVPVTRRGSIVGYLVAVADIARAFDSMAADHKDLGYFVAITDGRTEVYAMPGSPSVGDRPASASAMLRVPGAAWRVHVWPKPELVTGMRSSLPQLDFVLGGLLGALVVVAALFGRTAQQRSLELRRAHDELDERVKQRTAELKKLSDSLQAEVSDRQRAEDSYRDLSGRLLRLQDEERRRFARELHDSTAQVLGALAINVDRSLHLARAGELPRLTQVLNESGRIVEEVTQEIRTVSHLLHPPMLDDLGLEYAVPWYTERFGERSGISVTLDIPPNLGRFSRETELTLFRVLQEALANVHRHSGSSCVSVVMMRTADSAALVIRDRGRGLPKGALNAGTRAATGAAPIGIGIAGMRQRVTQLKGVMDISSDGRGTTVRAVMPLTCSEPIALPADEGLDTQPGPTTTFGLNHLRPLAT